MTKTVAQKWTRVMKQVELLFLASLSICSFPLIPSGLSPFFTSFQCLWLFSFLSYNFAYCIYMTFLSFFAACVSHQPPSSFPFPFQCNCDFTDWQLWIFLTLRCQCEILLRLVSNPRFKILSLSSVFRHSHCPSLCFLVT